jgi:hypothetical protein
MGMFREMPVGKCARKYDPKARPASSSADSTKMDASISKA